MMLLSASPDMPTLGTAWFIIRSTYCVGMAHSLEITVSSYNTPARSKNTRTSGQLRLIGAG